jgi:hypothetical protein
VGGKGRFSRGTGKEISKRALIDYFRISREQTANALEILKQGFLTDCLIVEVTKVGF